MVDAVSRGFRKHGFSGAGVDGLAKDAGVTSGAFYGHFGSKSAAFQEAIAAGLEQFRSAVEQFQQQNPEHWLDDFARFYLGEKRTCDLGDSCALQSLSPEVARSDEATREVFQQELLKASEIFSTGLTSTDEDLNVQHTWATMAMLIGGVTLARAVNDKKLSDDIAAAVVAAIDVYDDRK
jgi:AcrR family transcriptional regulator